MGVLFASLTARTSPRKFKADPAMSVFTHNARFHKKRRIYPKATFPSLSKARFLAARWSYIFQTRRNLQQRNCPAIFPITTIVSREHLTTDTGKTAHSRSKIKCKRDVTFSQLTASANNRIRNTRRGYAALVSSCSSRC